MNIFNVNKELIIQKIDKKTVIFDGEKSLLYTLNETASQILLYIKKGWDSKRIGEKISLTYKVSMKQAENDINTIIKDLLKRKIIYKREK